MRRRLEHRRGAARGTPRCLERGAADLLVLCTNTVHRIADGIQSALSIPLLHLGVVLWLLLIAVAAAGAVDAASARAAAGSPAATVERFLLTKADLPARYKLEERKRFSSRGCPDRISPAAVRKQLTKLGFRGCALAMFSKEVDVGNGVSYLHNPESVAVLMRDDRAASAALRVLRRMLLASLPTELRSAVHSLPVSRLGVEAPRGLTLALGEINAFIYIWRRGNVVAWTSTSDILHDFDARAALKLARTLDARGAT